MRLIIFVFPLLIACEIKVKPSLVFEKLYLADQRQIEINSNLDTFYIFKSNNFTVENFEDINQNEYIIDSFICHNVSDSYKIFRDYHITVFKKSKYTNNEYFNIWKKDFELKSMDDILFNYVWRRGKFWEKWHKQDGVDQVSSFKYKCEVFEKEE
ncbi:MAG: hypothetical protein WBB17_03990 [Saprospiraceae bacterium]|nr:hypothetical protein [Saprospiraceae bacterium]